MKLKVFYKMEQSSGRNLLNCDTGKLTAEETTIYEEATTDFICSNVEENVRADGACAKRSGANDEERADE